MSEPEKLIPPAPVVREHLSRNIKERRRLRALLRLAVREAEDRRQDHHEPRHEADGRAVEQ